MRQESCTRSCVSWLASLALHTNRGSPPSPVCTAVSHAVCPTVHAFPCRQRIHVRVVSARSLAALRPSEPSFPCPTPWYGPPSRRPRYLWKLASLATTPASPACCSPGTAAAPSGPTSRDARQPLVSLLPDFTSAALHHSPHASALPHRTCSTH